MEVAGSGYCAFFCGVTEQFDLPARLP